jgi:hypothetical protein
MHTSIFSVIHYFLLRHIFYVPALVLLGLNAAFAQAPSGTGGKAILPPPSVQRGLSDDLEPTVTIKKIDEQQVEEFRIRGKLYMMRVTPKLGGKPYYLIDKDGSGHFEAGENYGSNVSVPQWVILEF